MKRTVRRSFCHEIGCGVVTRDRLVKEGIERWGLQNGCGSCDNLRGTDGVGSFWVDYGGVDLGSSALLPGQVSRFQVHVKRGSDGVDVLGFGGV